MVAMFPGTNASQFAFFAIDHAVKKMNPDTTTILLNRLDQIETILKELVQQRAVKEWYSTAEVAEKVGKAEYTVREWCRQGRARAEKTMNGRGWLISHDELMRVCNQGPLPIPKHTANGVSHRARD